MPDRFDALVVGAGIVGAACAWQLAEAGLAVGVLERDTVGAGATAAGMGHIVVMNDRPEERTLTRYSQGLWERWLDAATARYEYVGCGTIWVAADGDELRALREKRDGYATIGVPCEVLDPAALHAAEPNLRPGLAGGLRVPGDGAVYAPRAAAAFIDAAVARGARVVRDSAVALRPGGVRLADGGAVDAGAVVLACGTDSARLAPEVPVRPKKGHLLITDRYPDVIRHQLVEVGYIAAAHAADQDSVSFNVQPRPSGQVLIGSSRQPGVGTSEVDGPILARMLRRAAGFVPCLSALSCIRAWTGLRAETPDGLPLIGPHPGRPGVWLATGHGGLGVTTAPATAALLAALLLGRSPPIPAAPYLPTRLLGGAAHG